jgi:type III restriction enzyme
MRTWFTGKPCEYTERSHINFCVYDSTWEATEAFELDRSSNVSAWVKNDHLGFEVLYIYQGVVHKYRPDFLVRLKDGAMLVLETKGQESDQDKTKRASLDEWVKAVNEHGEFGKWGWAVSRSPGDVAEILHQPDKASPGDGVGSKM